MIPFCILFYLGSQRIFVSGNGRHPALHPSHKNRGLEENRKLVLVISDPDIHVILAGENIAGHNLDGEFHCPESSKALDFLVLLALVYEIDVVDFLVYREFQRNFLPYLAFIERKCPALEKQSQHIHRICRSLQKRVERLPVIFLCGGINRIVRIEFQGVVLYLHLDI